MPLTKCPDCGKDVSTSADNCPHCGYPFRKQNVSMPISYETQVVKIRCWGRSSDSINEKLSPYTRQGWEVQSMVEDHWEGGLLSPVYKVTMHRPKK